MKTRPEPIVVTILLLAVLGCGLFSNKVPDKQIDEDIAKQKIKLSDNTETSLSGVSERCFMVHKDDSKTTKTNADVSVTVSSWSEFEVENKTIYNVVYGKMMLHYKKDGSNWILESAEPKDFSRKFIDMTEFKKFVELQQPLCKYHRYAKWAK